MAIAGAALANFFDDPFDHFDFFFDGALFENAFRANLGARWLPDSLACDVSAFVAALFHAAKIATAGYAEVFASAIELRLGNLLGFLHRSADFHGNTFATATGALIVMVVK